MATSARRKRTRTRTTAKPTQRTARKPTKAPVSQPSLPPAAPETTPALPVAQLSVPDSGLVPATGKVPLRYCPNAICGRPNYSAKRRKCSICQTVLPPVPRHASVAKLGNDSLVRRKALHIVAMRLGGMSTDDIAKALSISKQSVYGYVYRATRNGWIAHDAPADRIEFSLSTKAIDALEDLLEDEETTEKTRAKVALGVMEYVAPKKGDQSGGAPTTVVAIKIEQPTGTPQPIREGAISGTPAFIDAEVVSDGH